MNRLEEIKESAIHRVLLSNPPKDVVQISREDFEYMIAEVKRLNEAHQQAKSEAFQLQRESWRNR